MILQDNVLKEYLKNVFFISGTPCGGKTTVSRRLGAKYGIRVFDIDEMFPEHKSKSDRAFQPNMNKSFADADEFFGRPVDEYKNWLINNTREQLDFILLDLIGLSREEKIICDCHLTIDQAEKLTDRSRVALMIKEPVNLAEEYCARPDHKDFRCFINSASDPATAKKVCSETLYSLNRDFYEKVRSGGWFYIDRAEGLSPDRAVEKTARHFRLVQ